MKDLNGKPHKPSIAHLIHEIKRRCKEHSKIEPKCTTWGIHPLMTWLTAAGNKATGAAEGNTSAQLPVQRQQGISLSWFQENQFHESTNLDMYAQWLQQCPVISKLGGFSQIRDPTEEQLVVDCGNYLAERVGSADLKEASLFLDVTGSSGNGGSLCNEDDLSSHGFVVAKWVLVLLWMTRVSGIDVCADYKISLVVMHALDSMKSIR